MNTSVAIAVGEGILLKNPTLSSNLLTKEWAKYLLKRMGLVKRKGNTKAKAKVEIEKLNKVRKLFHQDIRNVIVMDEVPAELVVNWVLIMCQSHSGQWNRRELGKLQLKGRMINARQQRFLDAP